MVDDDRANVDWEHVFAEAVAMATTLTTRDPEDVVEDGMELYFAGAAPYDPAGGDTLAGHLVTVGLDAREKKERSERRRRRPRVVAKVKDALYPPAPTPEDEYAGVEEESRVSEQILEEFADDPEAARILLLEQQGVHKAAHQAERSGMDITVVRNTRKRIQRRLEAIAEEEKEAVSS